MSKPVVVSLCAQKGGTCKTTTAIELTTYASLCGNKTLVIDFDPQGSLTDVLGVENEVSATIYDVLTGTVTPIDALQNYSVGAINFDVLPANETLTHIGNMDFGVLASYIEELYHERKYDVVVIDSAPMPQTSMAFNTFAASDWVIMPTRATRQAVKSLTKTVKTMRAFSDANLGNPKIAGVLVCDFDKRGASWRAWLEGITQFCLQSEINLFADPIRHTVKVEDAQTNHLSVMVDSPRSFAACDYQQFCRTALTLMGLEVK